MTSICEDVNDEEEEEKEEKEGIEQVNSLHVILNSCALCRGCIWPLCPYAWLVSCWN